MLDSELSNKPRDLYVDKLIQRANGCEETIATYRHILAKRARQSDTFPNGPLCARRTTKLETSAKRYANDCFALQSFIYDNDPKHLTDVIVKRRITIKSEPNAPDTTTIGITTFQIELAELKAQVLELKAGVHELKQEQLKDKNTIKQLENEVSKLKMKSNTYHDKNAKNTDETENKRIQPKPSESLFENIRRKNEASANLKTISVSTGNNNEISRCVHENDETNKVPNATENSNQITDKTKAKQCNTTSANENNRVNDDDTRIERSDANTKPDNEQNDRNTVNDFNELNAINNETENDEANNEKHEYAEHHDRDIEDHEMARSFGNRNLYLYYNGEGHPRFGRHEPTVDNSDRANPPNASTSTTSPPRQIDVHYTNRITTRDKPRYNRNINHRRNLTRNLTPADHQEAHSFDQNRQYAASVGASYQTQTFASFEPERDEPIFESVVRRKTIRYYVGNIGSKSNRAGLVQFLNELGVEPVGVRIITTNRGCLAAKITVYASDRYTVEAATWPKKVYCRRWYGKQTWNARADGQYEDERTAYDVD